MRLDEDLAVEAWRVLRFTKMGFDRADIDVLQAWRTDLHDVEYLMFRNGERTSCTPAQALAILQPIEDYHVLTVEAEVEAWATAR